MTDVRIIVINNGGMTTRSDVWPIDVEEDADPTVVTPAEKSNNVGLYVGIGLAVAGVVIIIIIIGILLFLRRRKSHKAKRQTNGELSNVRFSALSSEIPPPEVERPLMGNNNAKRKKEESEPEKIPERKKISEKKNVREKSKTSRASLREDPENKVPRSKGSQGSLELMEGVDPDPECFYENAGPIGREMDLNELHGYIEKMKSGIDVGFENEFNVSLDVMCCLCPRKSVIRFPSLMNSLVTNAVWNHYHI